MGYSNTYRAIAVAALGFILKSAGKDLPDEQVANIVSDLSFLAGALWVLYERYKHGDLHWSGMRKK